MVKVNQVKIGDNLPLVLIAGPCVVENREITLSTAERIIEITNKLNVPFIFKSSFKKANRTSLNSFTGLEFDEAISILKEVKENYKVPLVTDIHSPED
ncbi:MAG: 3-deoxy-8-phosphooctulonate synthase, partial [Ignavibacteriae bacterium]|nr:3-deoxy-8-phosphooctulonate synthase [Ignavibacteriota bacterium]